MVLFPLLPLFLSVGRGGSAALLSWQGFCYVMKNFCFCGSWWLGGERELKRNPVKESVFERRAMGRS